MDILHKQSNMRPFGATCCVRLLSDRLDDMRIGRQCLITIDTFSFRRITGATKKSKMERLDLDGEKMCHLQFIGRLLLAFVGKERP